MENLDWLILKTLHIEKNITKTAEILHMSQPAMTKRLKQIETEFGIEIVHRGRRGIQFTPKGEYLAKCADDMLSKLQNIRDNLSNMDNDVEGTLRVAASYFFTRNNLPEILSLFKSKYPKVEFKVTSGWSKDIYSLVYNQDVHVAFIRGDYNWQFEKHLIFEETLCIVSKDKIDIKDLPKLQRIDYKGDNKLMELINNWWWENYFDPPSICMEVDKSETCIAMVMGGLGYAIVPSMVVKDIKDIYKIDLLNKDGTPLKRETWMFYNKEFLELKLVKTFVDFVEGLSFDEQSS